MKTIFQFKTNLFTQFDLKQKRFTFFFALLSIFLIHAPVKAQNCSVNANIDFTLCANETMLLIGQKAGLFYGSGTTTWSQVSGPSVNIVSPNALTTAVTGFSGGTVYKFRLSTKCLDGTTTYDEVTYTVKPITQSYAGPDLSFCPGTPAGLMSANSVGANETGSWLISGTNNGITLANAASPTSSINIDPTKSGATKLVWTINNTNGCLSRDTVILTNRGGVTPVNAGVDKTLTNCYSSTQTTSMAATYGGSGIDGQTGTWTLINGPSIATIVSPNSNTTNVTGLIEGTYTLRWTVSGPCGSGSDDVLIIVPPATSSVSTASISGGNPNFCDGRTSTVLTATAPSYINETGVWSKTSGPAGAVIESPNNNVTNITGLSGVNSYTFKYTITNSITSCSSSATTTISYSTPAAIDITPVQTILPCGQTFAVIPYTVSGSGTVQWSIVSGPKTPTYTSIPTNYANASGSPLTINGLTVSGTYVIRLKKSSGTGPNCNTVFDDVTVVVSANPTGSNSGTKQILACNVTQTALAGNNPYVGTGSWTQIDGPNTAIIDSVNKFDSQMSGLISGLYNFRWLISGGPYCSTQQSDVSIVVVSANPSQANAGPDITTCYNTPLYLNGNNPLLNETGTWTVSPSAGVSFSDSHSPKAIVNGLAANTTYTFIWKIENACSSNKDTLIVTTNNTMGPVQANAGPDQCKTAGTTTVTLAANNPGTSTGTWTKLTGGSANITSPNLYNTTVTGLTNGTYTFEWAILSPGACNPSRDTVMITISNAATTSNAGSDQQICGNSALLAGNNPAVGTGTWSQLTGNGGATIANPTNSNTNISGLTNGVYNFLWTISNNACPANSDTITLFVTIPPTSPDAGVDFTVCGYDTTSLNANLISVGTGMWSYISGPNSPVFTNINNPKTKVSGLISGTYVFRWSSYNGPFCPLVYDDVTVNVVLPANAGANQSFCEATTTANLSGNTSSSGTWSQVSGPNTSIITPTSTNTATASNLIPGTYTFMYSINTLGCNSSSTTTVILYPPPTIADAGTDASYCSKDTIQLNGNTPIVGVGTWSKLSGPTGGSFKPNANTPNAIYVSATAGTYVFVWKISNNSCSNSDQVIIKNYANPTSANAGFDQTSICSSTTNMSANLPATGLGNWTLISGPNSPEIVSPILPSSAINNLIPGTYNFEWSISNGVCPIKKDTVILIVNPSPTLADAGNDQILCNVSSATMQAVNVTSGIGTWTQYSGPNTAVIANQNSATTQITGLINGTYIFTWTTSLPPCSTADQVIITVYENPTIANAGSDINNCIFTPLILLGNSPGIGVGQWTQISGPVNVTILSPNSPSTYILGSIPGNFSFKWTISNGICNASTDTVNVVVTDIPSIAVTGSDQLLCNITSFNLNAETPLFGTGTWTQNIGPVVNISNINNPNSLVTGVVPGIYKFTWQTANNYCISEDNINITVYEQPTAYAGNNQDLCNANSFTMAASIPSIGTGLWTKVSGPNTPVITNPSSPTTSITGCIAGTYVFKWTVSNGNCTPATSQVTITNYANPTTANAGVTQNICSSTATMAANTVTSGIGTWSQVSGPNTATIANINLKNTNITNLIQGIYVFKWSITNGNCTPSTSNVTINVSEPPTVANAGLAQNICNAANVILDGNPASNGSGLWSLVSGPNSPTIVNPALNNTTVNGLINGIYIFKWTISNGNCSASSSQVTITNNQLPTIADAGSAQNLCNATSTTLSGNIPSVGNGTWSFISGPNNPVISNTSLFNTSVTAMIPGTYVFRWTISNASCPTSYADVTVNNSALPTIADAGIAQILCNANAATLNANAPIIGNGNWTLVSGPNTPLIANTANNNSNVTGLTNGIYTFKWTISNGNCPVSESQLTITNNQLPTVANAGSSQDLCNTTSTTLSGNIPVVGNGTWSFISGPNSPAISNTSLYNTSVTAMIPGTYVFRWTISNANCPASYADVTVNNSALPTIADAGIAQILCNANAATLNANAPIIGNGNWTLVSGPNTPLIANAANNNSNVTGLTNGIYTFKWTISNGNCPVSESQLTITNNQLPTVANAGVIQNLCSADSTILNGNIPVSGNGLWTLTSGPNTPVIHNPNLYNSSVTGLITGIYVFKWSISNGNCPQSSDEVTINNIVLPNTSNAGINQDICGTNTTLAANIAISGTSGIWTQNSGPNTAVIVDPNLNTSAVSGLIPGTYNFSWTISNGYCTPSVSNMNIVVYENPTIANAGNNQTFCQSTSSSAVLNANSPVVGTGNWSQINGPNSAVIDNQNSPTSSVSGLTDGTYTFRWTISNGTCTPSFSDVNIEVLKCIDLSVNKKLTNPDPLINDTIYKNDTVTFTITLKNNSQIYNATNISILDTLPIGLYYISSATSNGNYNPVTGLWTLANLNASDSAILTIDVRVDTTTENNVYIIGHNEPDSNIYNNKDFASVSITPASGGNNGGLESNGNMASKIALRNFIRHKEKSDDFDNPTKMELFNPATIVSSKLKGTQTTELISFIPQTGPTQSQAVVSTPTDLIGISNAIEVVAVDYFDAVKRKAAILGIASNSGTVYEHTKMVCDRLDGAKLNSINYVMIKGHPFIIAWMVQDNANNDYTVSFIAYKNGNTYTIDNQWDLDNYSPSGNNAVMNFQVWAINEEQTVDLVTKIIDKMISNGYIINYKNTEYPKYPDVYVQSGIYKDGKIDISLINKNASTSIQLNGNRAYVEDGIRYPFSYTTTIPTDIISNHSIPTSNIFDIGFNLTNNNSMTKDVLYFADGPWGRDFDQTGATITDFSISTQLSPPLSGAFNLGRSANLEGNVKTYASLFRVLRVGNKPIDLSNYNKLEFTAYGSGSYDVIISKSSINTWSNQYKTTIILDNNIPNTFKIPFTLFSNAQGQFNFTANDAVSVVFTKKGNNSSYQNFIINVKDMKFTNNTSGIENPNRNLSLSVYPNPFNSTTNISFNIENNQKVKIELISLEGKLVKTIENKVFEKGINTLEINSDNINSGIYFLKLSSNNNDIFEKLIILK